MSCKHNPNICKGNRLPFIYGFLGREWGEDL